MSKISDNLRKKAEELNPFVSRNRGSYQDFIIKKIQEKKGKEFAEFCRLKSSQLQLEKIKSHKEAEGFVSDFLNGYDICTKNESNPFYKLISSINDAYNNLDSKAKKDLENNLKKSLTKKTIASEGVEIMKNLTGIDMSEGPLKGLKDFVSEKLSFGKKDEDKFAAKTESKSIEDVFDSTTVNTFSSGIKGMIFAPLFSVVGLGGVAGGVIPIAMMFLPVLLAWDAKKIISNTMGSPHEEGTLSNLVKEKTQGKNPGPSIC